jgi:hypothetical protein
MAGAAIIWIAAPLFLGDALLHRISSLSVHENSERECGVNSAGFPLKDRF